MKYDYIEELRVAGSEKEHSRLKDYLSIYYPEVTIKEVIRLGDQRAWKQHIDYILSNGLMIDTKTYHSGWKEGLYLNLQKVYLWDNKRHNLRLENVADLMIIFQPEGRTIEIKLKELYNKWKDITPIDVGFGILPWWQTVHQKNSKTQQIAFSFSELILQNLCEIRYQPNYKEVKNV